MKVRDIIKIIEADGWVLDRTRGSHRQYRHPRKSGTVTIAGALDRGTSPEDPKQHSKAGGTETAMRYAVIIERVRAGYSAYVPDLPGCIAAGSTESEVRRLIKEAVDFHLEGIRLHGDPIPEPTTSCEYVDAVIVDPVQ